MYFLKKGLIEQEDITIINIYTPNDRPLKYMKLKLTIEGKDRQIYIYIWRLHYSIHNRG